MEAEDRDVVRRRADGQTTVGVRDAAQPLPDVLPPDQPPLTEAEYQSAHGESLATTLDLSTWLPGSDLAETYARLEREVAEAVRKEAQYQQKIRETIFPALRSRQGAPPCAGVFKVTIGRLEEIHRKLLFNGAVEACDGTVASHDTLPVTITQIGVCLVSYSGNQGSWVQRLYRRDIRTTSTKDLVEETMELLERRRKRGGTTDQKAPHDRLAELARRGIMAYAERAVLLDKCEAVWRMGHGNPTPYELVTGSGMPDLLRASLQLMTRLVVEHERFVFVPSSTTARELLTIGNALQPLEYAIIDTNQHFLDAIAQGHYRGEAWSQLKTAVDEFVDECGPKIVVGMYRASSLAPAQMFYAHVRHAHEAALIAMADSVLQEHRGFPMLIDLADGVCHASFGADTFTASTQLAYAQAGEPFRYFSERKTRR
jgi:hypothetical protein